MLLITAGIVLAFVAFSFRSLFLPIRSILTIGMTIIWVYGFADLGMKLSLQLTSFLHSFPREISR